MHHQQHGSGTTADQTQGLIYRERDEFEQDDTQILDKTQPARCNRQSNILST